MKKLNICISALSIVFITLSFFSCVEEVNSKYLPSTTPKIVLHCYISPEDSFINVRLTKSKPVFYHQVTQEIIEIQNATVQISNISNASEKFKLNYNVDSGLYQLSTKNFAIKRGETYKIEGETFEGTKFSATTKVPDVSNTSVELISVDSSNNEYSIKYIVRFKIIDAAGQENFYRVIPLVNIHNEEVFLNEYNVYDTLVNDYEYIPEMSLGSEFITDKNKDGGSFLYEVKFEDWKNDQGLYGKRNFKIKLQCINSDYFYYCLNMHSDNGMELFSEPITQFNNVSGGIGVFAAYYTNTIEFNF